MTANEAVWIVVYLCDSATQCALSLSVEEEQLTLGHMDPAGLVYTFVARCYS